MVCAAPEASEWGDHQEDTMRKLLLVNIAVAAVGAAALMPGRADATTLGTAAGLRSAVDGAAPIEEVTYWRYRHHRRHAFYPYASTRTPSIQGAITIIGTGAIETGSTQKACVLQLCMLLLAEAAR